MNDTETSPVRAFTNALPPHARAALHLNQTIDGMIHAAIRDHQWTVTQLAAECGRDLDGVVNAGAVINHRLRHAAGNPPAQRASTHTVIPLCGHCEDGWILDDKTRLPTGKCPCRTPQPGRTPA